GAGGAACTMAGRSRRALAEHVPDRAEETLHQRPRTDRDPDTVPRAGQGGEGADRHTACPERVREGRGTERGRGARVDRRVDGGSRRTGSTVRAGRDDPFPLPTRDLNEQEV